MRTNEELNRVIAEWCGYKWPDHPDCMAKKVNWTMPEKWLMKPDGTLGFLHDVPDYCKDLNAIHEAEEKWCSSDLAYNKYSDTLFTFHLENQTKLKKPWRWIITTARERSEVLVKMIEGKQE